MSKPKAPIVRFKKEGDPAEAVRVDYTNHRGVREVRVITPLWVEWVEPGFNQYHPEGGWMLACWCHRAKDRRAFAMKDIHAWGVDARYIPPAPGNHGSHKTRFSDSSLYDEKCVKCGATDAIGDDRLKQPCLYPDGPEKY